MQCEWCVCDVLCVLCGVWCVSGMIVCVLCVVGVLCNVCGVSGVVVCVVCGV